MTSRSGDEIFCLCRRGRGCPEGELEVPPTIVAGASCSRAQNGQSPEHTLYMDMPETFRAPVGLRVDVRILP